MTVLDTDLLMIERGGQLYRAPVDALPKANLTSTTLTHTAGAITWDVQAADVFAFEADTYVPDGISVLSTTSGAGDVNFPTGLTENDYVFILTASTANRHQNAPAGWTEDFAVELQSGSGDLQLFYKKMGPSPDTDVVFGIEDSYTSFLCLAVRGVDGVNPLDVPSKTVLYHGSDVTSYDPPSITTVNDNSLVVATAGSRLNSAGGWSNYPSGYSNNTEAISAFGHTASGLATKAVSTAGAENPSAFVKANSASKGAAATFALRAGLPSGEKDHTLSITNKPVGTVKRITLDFETKTDVGSVDVSDVDEWVGGAAPAFDSVGKHRMVIDANSVNTVGWYLGVVA